MTPKNPFTRRSFLATTSTVLGAAALPLDQGGAEEPAKLALHGGAKTVKSGVPALARWGEPERKRMNALIDQSNMFYWKGPQTTALIEEFRKTYPLKHIMTCSSGTGAIHTAVSASGVGPGDEVITTPISDIGSVVGVLYQQAVPVFADLGRNTYNLDPEDVARKITPKTKAIIAVHLAGNPCDMTALKELADRHKLVLIEDCAQAWGATYRGKPVGTIGHIGCFSLQAAKHVTSGEGGVVASSDPRFGPLLQKFGDKGIDRVGRGGLFEVFATNYRMSEPQAGFATAQLTRLEGIAEKRARLGNQLNKVLAGLPGIEAHQVHPDDRCSYWFLMLRIRPETLKCDRAEFVKTLAAEGVPASAGYIPVPLYANPVFQNHGFFAGRWPAKEMGLTTMDYSKVSCPEAESILKLGVRVTIHEGMSEAYVSSLGDAFRKVTSHYAKA